MNQRAFKPLVILLTLSILFLLIQTLQAQDWNATFTVDPFASPYVSDWQNDPTLAILEIHNNSREQDVIIVDLELNDANGILLQASSRRILVQPEQPLYLNTTDYMDWTVTFINSSAKDQISRTGMFPEGDYEACISIRNLWGNELVPPTCAYTSIVHPDPPELIYPIEYQEIYMPYPIFQWIPPQTQYGRQMVYVFRLVEIMSGQLPNQALETNYPHYENYNVFTSDFEYPLDGLPLEPGKAYAWQIQAVDLDGRPATRNEGKSIIGVFTTSASFEGLLPKLELLSPVNNALLTTRQPLFECIEPLVDPVTSVFYTIHISEMTTGQTPEQALATNTPFFINSTTLTEPVFRFPLDAPQLKPGKNYAWQMTALDPYGQPVTANEGKSEVRAFTVAEGSPILVETQLLPEKLCLPTEEIAYLLLKQNDNALVQYSFSEDSSEITVTSLSPGTTPLVFPCLQGDNAEPPRTGASVSVTFDRYTHEILSGEITASITPATESPFDLAQMGIPVAVRTIEYEPASQTFSFAAVPSLFNTQFTSSLVNLTLSASGVLAGTVPHQQVLQQIPLVPNSARLVYLVQSLEGEINSSLLSDMHQSSLDISGNLAFLPALPQLNNRSIAIDMQLIGNKTQLVFAGNTPDPAGISLTAGSLQMILHQFVCNTFNWSFSEQNWNFDFTFDVNISFTDIHPQLDLPQISSVHLTPEGFNFPQTSIPDLGFDQFFAYQDVQIKPFAFRMQKFTFDWFTSSDKNTGNWGFRFDFLLKLSLNSGLTDLEQELSTYPLTVLNAVFDNGCFIGTVEPRTFPSPITAPLSEKSKLLIEQIKGELKQESGIPKINFSVLSDCILPAATEQDTQTIDFDQLWLQMNTQGIFTGQSPQFVPSYPLPWQQLELSIQTADLLFGEKEGAQTALLDLNGSIELSISGTSKVSANGSGQFNLITEQITNGQFLITEPFDIDVPAFTSNPTLQLRCTNGARVNPNGLQLNNAAGELLLGNTMVTLQYSDNVTFSLPDLKLATGTINFDDTFALHIKNLTENTQNMLWQALDPAAAVPDDNSLLLPLPSVTVKNGILRASGNATATVNLNNQTYPDLEARFSTDFSVGFYPTNVASGRLDFYADNVNVAYLDSTGFWPSSYFASDSLFTLLPLPDSSIAYAQLYDSQGISLIETEQQGENIRVYTLEGNKVPIYFPALSLDSGPVPMVQTALNLVVNSTTRRPVSGSLTITASEGNRLVSLKGAGLPLNVTGLYFDDPDNDGNFQMSADLQPILPQALQSADLKARKIPLTAKGFERFDTREPDPENKQTTRVDIGEYLNVSLDGLRASISSAGDSVVFSGEIRSSLFKHQETSLTKAIPFSADLSTDSARFHLDPAHLSQAPLPLGCGEFRILSDGNQSINVSAAMNRNLFELTIQQGILSLPQLSDGFHLTLNELRINQDSVSIPDINLSSGNEQVLSLFGTDLTLRGVAFDIPSPELLEMHLNGSMLLFGKDIGFSDLKVTTDCALANTSLTVNPVELVEKSLSLDSLHIRNSNLYVYGMFTAFKPFNDLSGAYSISINSEGNWIDDTGNVLQTKTINILSGESPESGVSLGMAPLDVVCKLADVNLSFNGPSNKEVSGHIDVDINSYWPTALKDDVKIHIIGSLRFPKTDGSQDTWLINETSVSVITLADLLNLEMNNISVRKDSVFAISLGGNFSFNLPSAQQDQGGGGEFRDFLLKEGTFEFGQVLNANFDISGVNVQISRLAFGFDLRNLATYDITFNENEASLNNTTVSHNGFYLVFGGTMSSELYGFDGGIDSLLVIKSPDRFYTLIKNAHFVYSDMINGSLDLVLDIGLDEVDYQFLVGGHVDVGEKGFAAVGEISYKSTNFGGQTFMSPGFGLFLGIKTGLNITLAPLPITIEGAGLGVFYNPDAQVEKLVRSHLGFVNGTENQFFFDAYNEYKSQYINMMTFMEIYAYANISVPEKAVLEAQALFTLATDKARLDFKVNVIGNNEFKKYCKLNGSGFLEAGVPQDFSDWPYAAGNITVGMTAKDQTGVKLINLPTPGQAESQIEFFVLQGSWALHGAIWAKIARSFETDFDFFLGPPGFLVDANIARSFDAVVVEVEIGMGLSVWYVWETPREWGGYGQAWVEATCLSDDFAGVRGELGAALVGEPDFYIYGYAELTAWFLDMEWTKCVWVEWRDGQVDGGTGGNSRMQDIIEQSRKVSDRIMDQADEIEYEILEAKRAAFTQFSAQDIRDIINTIRSGQAGFYYEDLKQDADAVIRGLNDYIRHSNDQGARESKSLFINYKDQVIAAFDPNKIGEFNGTLDDFSGSVDRFSTVLSDELDSYKSMYESLKTQIQESRISLDTLVAFSNLPDKPIENPIDKSMIQAEGPSVPVFSIDHEKTNKNKQNVNKLQNNFKAWLDQIVEKVNAIETLRSQLYNGFGPGSEMSDTQIKFTHSLLHRNTVEKSLLDKVSEITDFYFDKSETCKNLYNQNTIPFNNIFIYSRWDSKTGKTNQEFVNQAIKRRFGALEKLAGGEIGIDLNSIKAWEAQQELGIAFYTTVPFLFYEFTLNKMDSLYNSIVPAYNQAFEARNDIHRDFTLNTDAIWNRYAQLSENLYNLYNMLIDEIKTFEKTFDTSAPISIKEVQSKMASLSDEFQLSALSDFSANRTDSKKRYSPISVEFNWTENENISEYAFSIAESGSSPFQSIGDHHQFGLDFLLPIGWPPSRKNYKVHTRIRNKAGYSVAGQAVSLDFEKEYQQSTSNINETTPYTDSDYVISSIDFPDHYIASGGFNLYYFKNTESQVHVDWQVNTSKGPSPFAEYRYKIYKQDSPGNPVVDWTTTGTLTGVIKRDLSLDANTVSPYIIQVAGIDAQGNVRDTRESPGLYIDHTPPHFPDDIEFELIKYDEHRVVFKCKQARDWFADESSHPDLYVRIDTLAAYQYKLYYETENPDSIAWQRIDDFGFRGYNHLTYKRSDLIVIDLGMRPLKADMKLALRACNLNSSNNNGFGKETIVSIPRQDDKTPPSSPSFEIEGKDEHNNIVLKIIAPAKDPESGISGYNYKLVDYFNDQRVIRDCPETGQIDFPVDSLAMDNKLVIPLDHDSLDFRGMWVQVYLTGVNYSGAFGMWDVDFICFPPGKPALDASLEHVSIPGSAPYTVLKFKVSTDPHASDFMVNMRCGTTENGREIEQVGYLFGPSYNHTLENSSRLPDSLTFGSPVYVTARSVSMMFDNQREKSEPVSIRLMTPDPPMFTEVTQNQDGYLMLPITSPAFNGRKSASYQFEIKSELSDNQTIIRPFPMDPGQADFSSDQVRKGEPLVLPVLAKNMSPSICVTLKAVSADGDVAMNKASYRPKPSAPEYTASIERHKHMKEYILNMQGQFDDPVMQGNSHIRFIIGSEKGKDDILSGTLSRSAFYGDRSKEASNIFYLPARTDQYSNVYFEAWNVTSVNEKSTASVDTILTLPEPLMFDQVKTTETDYLSVHMLSSGFGPDVSIAGYQFAVFINDETQTPIRPFPASLSEFDFTPQQVVFGETLELPVHLSELPLQKAVLVALRAISTTDKTVTYEKGYMPYPPIPVVAFITKENQGDLLRFQGTFEDIYLFGGQLTMHFSLGTFVNSDDVSTGQFEIGADGQYNAAFRLSDVQVGRYYHLSCWYFTNNQKSGVDQQQLSTPCDPMFTEIKQPDEQTLALPIVATGFNGDPEIQGYQYAVGGASGSYDVRPFPTSPDNIDFTPDQVQTGRELIINQPTRGLPEQCFVALKAVHSSGVTDVCEQSFHPQPPTPVIRLLGLRQPVDGNTNILRFEVDNTSLDSKAARLILAAYYGSRFSLIVTEDGKYTYPTWDWPIVYDENSSNPVIECHLTKLMPTALDYFVEIKSKDRYYGKQSGTFLLKFNIDSELNLHNIKVVQSKQ